MHASNLQNCRSPHPPAWPAGTSAALGMLLSASVAIAFAATYMECRHWFVFPVTLCGSIVARDAIDWLAGRMDRFDPVGIVGVVGWHFFFFAPLLHVAWDYWLPYVTPPPDWRDYIGQMALLNAAGLSLYVIFRDRPVVVGHSAPRMTWRLSKQRFGVLVGIGLVTTALLQAWSYARLGGIVGYIEAATDLTDPQRMQGMGKIFMVSESFPILAAMSFVILAAGKPVCRSWLVLVPALLVCFGLLLIFGGLRGSRSNTIWSLFWVVGMIHYWVRPVSRTVVAIGCVSLVSFMFVYGFYKAAGLNGLKAVRSSEERQALSERSGRTLETTLLADLGRSDVQAFLLYRLTDPSGDYEYAIGRSYLGDIAILIPSTLWPNRPPHKSREGTEALYGRGTYEPVHAEASQVYGLAGEAMLNFGPAAVPPAYALFGWIVGAIRRRALCLPPYDVRWLVYPFFVSLCFMILVSDLDNLIFNCVKNLTVPVAVLIIGSSPFRIARHGE